MGNNASGQEQQLASDRLGKVSLEDARRVWFRYDRDRDGQLNRNEARAFLSDVLRREGVAKDALAAREAALFASLDKNGDGALQWNELTGVALVTRDARATRELADVDPAALGPLFGRLNRDGSLLSFFPFFASCLIGSVQSGTPW